MVCPELTEMYYDSEIAFTYFDPTNIDVCIDINDSL